MLFLLFFTFFTFGHSFLPEHDLTNSVYNQLAGGIQPDYDNEDAKELLDIDKSTEDPEDARLSPYRRTTFRRRNINSGSFLGGSSVNSPFNRMAYKSAYGSSRGPSANSFNRNRMSNFGNSMSSGYGINFPTESFNNRGSFQSGLLSGNKRNNGFFGSYAVRSNKYKNRQTETFPKNSYGSNDIMGNYGSPLKSYGSKLHLQNNVPFINTISEQGRYPNNIDFYSTFDNRLSAQMRRESDPYKLQMGSHNWASNYRAQTAPDDSLLDGYADAKKMTSKT